MSRKWKIAPLALLLALTLLALTLLALTGCDEEMAGPLQAELRTDAVCHGGVGVYDVFVERRVSAIGPAGNDLVATDGFLWVLESGSNTVSRFDRAVDEFDSGFIDVGNERNPYSMAIDETTAQVWIANFATHTVSIADMDSAEILAEIDDESFKNPSAVALTETHAYVANVNFLSLAQGYGPGSVTVIDRQTLSVVASVETAFENPHYLAIYSTNQGPLLFVSGSGAIERAGDRVEVKSEGGLEIFDVQADPIAPTSESFPLGQQEVQTVGAPGRPLLATTTNHLYFVSGIAPVLFVFDLENRRWDYDAASPLEFARADGDATHQAVMGPEGLLWITAFNQDALYLFDTACHKLVAPPIDLGQVADMLEGPHAIVAFQDGEAFESYYLLGIANALGRVRLIPAGDQ